MQTMSICLVSHGQLIKMLITLELHGIFSLNFAYLYIHSCHQYQIELHNDKQELCHSKSVERATCIKGLYWPSLEPKTETVALHHFFLIGCIEEYPNCKSLASVQL